MRRALLDGPSALPPFGERADLVGLQLGGGEAGGPPVVKSATHRGGPLEPPARHAQQFLSVHGLVLNLFRVGRHLLRSAHHRLLRTRAFAEWDAVTCAC